MMDKLRRYLSLFTLGFAVCLLTIFCNITTEAYAQTSIISDKGNAISSYEFEVPVKMQDNPGIMGFGCQVIYDALVMKPVSIRSGNVFSSGSLTDGIGVMDGSFKVLWSGTEATSVDGDLFWITFHVDVLQDIDSEIQFLVLQEDTFNANFEDVQVNNGTYTAVIRTGQSDNTKIQDLVETPEIVQSDRDNRLPMNAATLNSQKKEDSKIEKSAVNTEREEDIKNGANAPLAPVIKEDVNPYATTYNSLEMKETEPENEARQADKGNHGTDEQSEIGHEEPRMTENLQNKDMISSESQDMGAVEQGLVSNGSQKRNMTLFTKESEIEKNQTDLTKKKANHIIMIMFCGVFLVITIISAVGFIIYKKHKERKEGV